MRGPTGAFWLATIGEANLAALQARKFPFYAVGLKGKYMSKRMRAGDKVLLYQSGKGVIGVFEVTGDAFVSADRFFPGMRAYPTRIPWKALSLNLEAPVDLRPLAPKLRFVSGKGNLGSYLQSTLRQIEKEDFDLIDSCVAAARGRAISPDYA